MGGERKETVTRGGKRSITRRRGKRKERKRERREREGERGKEKKRKEGGWWQVGEGAQRENASERDKDAIRNDAKCERNGETNVETATRRRSARLYSQCFVAEIGRFWWVELVQLAVEYVEAIEAHFGLDDRRVAYTRAVRQHRRTVTGGYVRRRVVVQLLLLRTATASSHVS